jgi:hypothetical protein
MVTNKSESARNDNLSSRWFIDHRKPGDRELLKLRREVGRRYKTSECHHMNRASMPPLQAPWKSEILAGKTSGKE